MQKNVVEKESGGGGCFFIFRGAARQVAAAFTSARTLDGTDLVRNGPLEAKEDIRDQNYLFHQPSLSHCRKARKL